MDLETTEALIEAIKEFQGGVLLVSHDQHLLTSVCKHLYVVEKGNVEMLRQASGEAFTKYKKDGFDIVISTSRNMLTYQNNLGKINANTLPVIIEWLNKYQIPFDEIYVGKPWCGDEGFYIDDKAIRPSEFLKFSYEEIVKILDFEK